MFNPNSPIVKRDSGESGKSIVEITMILMVIGIVMAFTLPGVSASIRAYKLRSVATQLVQKMSAARGLAMTKNKDVALSLNKARGEFGFDFTTPTPDGVPDYAGGPDETTPAPDGIPDTTDPDDRSTAYYPVDLPEGISVDFGAKASITVKFNSRGELPIGSTEQAIKIQYSDKYTIVHVNLRGKIWIE